MISPSDSQSGTKPEVSMPRLFQFDLVRALLQPEGFPEPANLHRVLDIASGAGEWAFAMAQMYPQTEIIGIERDTQLVDAARAQVRLKGASNVSFTQSDSLHEINLPDNSFDLVNLRFVANIIPKDCWSQVLRESLRLTRLGGIIRLTETDLPISNSVAFERFNGLIARALYTMHQSFSPDGVSFAITPILSGLLAQAGCVDIQRATFITNFSAGMEVHTSVVREITRTYQLALPFLIQADIASQEELAKAYQEMLNEMQTDSFCATAFYLTVWGRKS